MDAFAVASHVIHGATSENIGGAKRLTEKGRLQEFEVTTETGRVFTVTVNIESENPTTGCFYEGVDALKAEKLSSFALYDNTQLEIV